MTKKSLSCLLLAVLFFFSLAGAADVPDKAFQFQMNGRWLPAVSSLHVGAQNYVELKNLRPTDSGLETVEGYSAISAVSIDTPVSMHHFSKGSESHVMAKTEDTGLYSLYDLTTAIPSAGEFGSVLYQGVGNGPGSFANGPQGTMFYADDSFNLVWGGTEMQTASFWVSNDATGASAKNYTANINNDVTSETAPVGAGGDDADAKLLLHCDGADASTTFTDDSAGNGGLGHTVTANGDAQIDTAFKKFGTASGLFDGTGDYLSIADHADWQLGTAFTIDLWMRSTDGTFYFSDQILVGQYVDADNYWYLGIINADLEFKARQGGVTVAHYTLNDSPDYNTWAHVACVRYLGDIYLSINGVGALTTTEVVAVGGTALSDLAGALTIGGFSGSDYYVGALDEVRISPSVARWTGSTFTPPTMAYLEGIRYFFVGSPLKLNGIKAYPAVTNTSAAVLAGATWTGSSWAALALTDNTSSGGKSMAQTGTVTWTYSDDPKPLYFNGTSLYYYRFDLPAGYASLYKVTTSAPLQPIRDVWNGSKRTCISFQASRNSVYEDYTFLVRDVDSSSGTAYAATVGNLAPATSDFIEVMFDDRVHALDITMFSAKVNTNATKFDAIYYWNGSAYVSVGTFTDGTLNAGATASLNHSGVIHWNPPGKDEEHPKEAFGKVGYSYKLTITGGATNFTNGTNYDGTSIDFVGGITAPLSLQGYEAVGTYNGRVMLIDKSRVDYSQTNTPWVFNGVDSSNNGRLSLYFGDDNPIVATTSLYNRYGSNLIQTWVALKKNASYVLTGAQPYSSLAEPFVIRAISEKIGCAAPMTLASYVMETGDGVGMGVAMWLDFSGPIVFYGSAPTKLAGVENFFDPTKTECIRYAYIEKAWSYIDTVHNQWNIGIPSGSTATAVNKILVYDFKHKKWFEKDPGHVTRYVQSVASVSDTYGAKYTYGMLSTGLVVRLDNTQAWGATAISQSIKTGVFSPAVSDDFGFWTRSLVRGVRLISEAITEDRDVVITPYIDGSASSNTITIALNSGGVISKNLTASHNLAEQGSVFQMVFTTTTSSDKWRPLAWGFRARAIRED